MKRIIIPFFLCLLLFAMTPSAFATDYTNPSDGWDVLVNDGVLMPMSMGSAAYQNKLESLLRTNTKTKLGATYFANNSANGGKQCWGLAQTVMVELVGRGAPGNEYFRKSGGDTPNLHGKQEFTYNSFIANGIPQRGATLIRTAGPATFETLSDDTKYGHSMVLLYYNQSYVYYVEYSGGKNHLQKLTWPQWTKKEFTDKEGSAGVKGTRKIKYTVIVSDAQFTKRYPDINVTIDATTLEFRNVVYPKTFRINTSSGWNLSGGMVVSDKELSTLDVKIINSNGTIVSKMSAPRTLSGRVFYISNLDGEGIDNGQRFSKITAAGNYIWIMTATDKAGRTVTIEMPFTAVSSGSTTTATMSSSGSTGYSETPLSGVYRFNKDDDARSGPGEAYDKIEDKAQGSIVIVVASAQSTYGYTWYKTTKNTWVYSGDVDKLNHTETAASGTYAFIRDDESRTWPYEDSTEVRKYQKGHTVAIIATLTNAYNNVWYKLSDGSYVWSGDVESVTTVSTLAFQGVKYPTNYKIGSSGGYSLSDGKLISNYELTSITTTIKKTDGTIISGPKTWQISGYSYDIKKLDTKDGSNNGVRFSYLSSSSHTGNYLWVLTGTDSAGRTLTMEMPFTASSNATVSSTMSLSCTDINRKVASVTITNLEGTETVGDTYYGYDDDSTSFKLQAWVTPMDASNPRITWSSSNENVLRLSSSESIDGGGTLGIFTKTGVGTTTITATAQDGSGKKAVYTYNYYVSSVQLQPIESQISIGQITAVIPTVQPSIAGYQNLTWSSSNPSVATVDAYGNVTGKSTGSTTISARASDGSGIEGTCIITVKSNITNIRAVMWESPYPEDDALWDLPVRGVKIGEAFTIDVLWDFSTSTSSYSVSYSTDANAGIEKSSDSHAGPGSFIAREAGTWNVYIKIYENGYLVESLTVPITVTWMIELWTDRAESISIATANTRAYLRFTPAGTGDYVFSSNSSKNVVGFLYDQNWHLLTQVYGTSNFSIPVTLQAGQTYYLGTRFWSESETGSYTVTVSPDVISGACGNNLTWVYDNGTLLIYGSGPMDDYRGLGQPWGGYVESIQHVYIEEGVTTIGRGAFNKCENIIDISLPSTLTSLGENAFYHCESLESIIVPSSVTQIGNAAFAYCLSLTSVTLPYGVGSIGEYVFSNCTTLEEISIPGTVTSLGYCAFSHCDNLREIKISSEVTSIGYGVFAACAELATVYIPPTVTDIGDDAFTQSGKVTIYCFDGSPAHSYAIANSIPYVLTSGICGDNLTWTVEDSCVTISGNGTMYDYGYDAGPWGKNIETVIIDSGVTSIGAYAFYDCSNLTHVALPSTLSVIGNQSFLNATALTSVYLPQGLEHISVDAFAGCTSLSMVSLPSTLLTIGGDAFQNTAITSITIPSSVYSIGGNPFCCTPIVRFNVESSVFFKVVDNVLYTKDGTRLVAYPCASTQTKYTVIDGTTEIGQNAFYGQMNLSQIVIPEGVTQIGGYSSYRSNTLERIYIPSSVTAIGTNAYGLCPNLVIYCTPNSFADSYANANNIPLQYYGGGCGNSLSWTLIDGTLTISGTGTMTDYDWSDNKSPWYGNVGIEDVVVKEGVTSIGYAAFCALDGLKRVSLPSTLTTIGDYAFDSDTSLTTINVASSNGHFCSVNGVLYSKDMKTLILCPPSCIKGTFVMPDSVVEIRKFAFKHCNEITAVSIPETTKRIGSMAFFLCSKLEYINLHDGIETIGEGAFSDCSSLSYISIPANVTRIESETFGCTNVKNLFIPEHVTYIAYWAFRDCDDLVISCYAGSAAHQFAVERGFEFILLDTPLNHPDFVLPDSTRVIEAEAFYGISAKRVKLSEETATIGESAFAYCPNLVAIYIPANCTSIAKSAFEGVTNLTIYGHDGSYAEFYANKYGFGFIAITD